MTITNLFAPIVKSAKNADGTLTVIGKASGPDLDLDQQIADPEWLSAEMPEWFETGNIREMHLANAIGKATEMNVDGDDYLVTSTIVDPVAVAKVEAGILGGYSIGIKAPRVVKDAGAPGGRIVGGKIIEVSLVDRPCNESCKVTLAKSVDAVLVKAEDVDTHAGITAELGKFLDADLVKADELELIQTVVAALAELIQVEAAELPTDSGGVWNIESLLCALRALREYWWDKSYQGDLPDPTTVAQLDELTDSEEEQPMELTLSAVADLVKTASADDATTDQRDELAELHKALGIADLVETATTEATKAAEERIAALEADLAKVKEMAVPDGPALSRGVADPEVVAQRDELLAKVAECDHLAETVNDRSLADGYRQIAADARAQLATIIPGGTR